MVHVAFRVREGRGCIVMEGWGHLGTSPDGRAGMVNALAMSLLWGAISTGEAEDAKKLIADGTVVSGVEDSCSKLTLLHHAVRFGNADVVKVLLDSGADLAARDSGGRTPLHTAARGVYEERVKKEDDADVSAEDRLTIARLLLDAGAEVGASALREGEEVGMRSGGSQNGWTPLHMAACNKHHAMATLLLERGADLMARTGFTQEVPLHFAVGSQLQLHPFPENETMVKILVGHGADLEAMDRDYFTPLRSAVFRGHVKMVRLLVGLGANLEAANLSRHKWPGGLVDYNRSTVLHLAVHTDEPKVAINSPSLPFAP